MNLLLHGIGAEDATSPIVVDDALRPTRATVRDGADESAVRRKSSMTFVNAEGEAEREDLVSLRDDFWASTSNKQLNFLQHVKTLAQAGRAGRDRRAGQRPLRGRRGETIRRKLLHECDVHTHLRLPTGRFYSSARREGERPVLSIVKPAAENAVDEESFGSTTYGTNKPSTLKAEPAPARKTCDDFVAALQGGRPERSARRA
jgi:type I restriction enzyme M protein